MLKSMPSKSLPKKKPSFVFTAGKLFRYFSFFICLLFMVFSFRGGVKYVYGIESDAVTGWAWSSNIGWIKMNCYQKGAPACSGEGGRDYGVDINKTSKNFSGYAWSSGVGWIAFQGNNAPNYDFSSHCPDPFCINGSGCTACLDPETGKVYGWAQVVSMGDKGWINLSSTTTYSTGVRIDQATASGSFRGWAWNKNSDGTGIGWISFNCLDSGGCASTGNYQTYLNNFSFPRPIELSAPNWSPVNACAGVARYAQLQWKAAGETLASPVVDYWRVIVSTSDNIGSPLIDTGKRHELAPGTTHIFATSTNLSYDTPYYWWVKVWDSFGFASTWVQFNTATPGHVLSDNVARNGVLGNSKTFTIYRHEFPDVVFSWAPLRPVVDEVATFTDASLIYQNAAPSTPVACTKNTCSWRWSSADARTNTRPTSSSTAMTFGFGNNFVSDSVTDAEGYACTSTQGLFADLLPRWRETKPQ